VITLLGNGCGPYIAFETNGYGIGIDVRENQTQFFRVEAGYFAISYEKNPSNERIILFYCPTITMNPEDVHEREMPIPVGEETIEEEVEGLGFVYYRDPRPEIGAFVLGVNHPPPISFSRVESLINSKKEFARTVRKIDNTYAWIVAPLPEG
jgi:hypothetical protein